MPPPATPSTSMRRELVLRLLHVRLHLLRLPHQLAQAFHRYLSLSSRRLAYFVGRMLSASSVASNCRLHRLDVRIALDRLSRARACARSRSPAAHPPASAAPADRRDRELDARARSARAARPRGACAAAACSGAPCRPATTSCHEPPVLDCRSHWSASWRAGPRRSSACTIPAQSTSAARAPSPGRARSARTRRGAAAGASRAAGLARHGLAVRQRRRGAADRRRRSSQRGTRLAAGELPATGARGASESSAGRNASMRSSVISKPMRGSRQYGRSRRPCSAIW